jgi:hypothetical protein
MKMIPEIDNITSKIDRIETEKFYTAQSRVMQGCDCEDCKYYEEEFIKKPIAIFKILKEYGVDLRKNVESEPTGAWVVRDEEEFICCEQAYLLKGDFKDYTETTFEINHEKFKTNIQVHKVDEAALILYVTIE